MPPARVRSFTQQALLQALQRGDSYGVDLVDCVKQMTEGKVTLKSGSVYPALRELERAGLVRLRPNPEPDPLPGRPRRYYALTAKGVCAVFDDRVVALGVFGLAWPAGTTSQNPMYQLRDR